MFGKVNESVQNKRLETDIKELKGDLQKYNQPHQIAPSQLDDVYEKIDELEWEIHLLKNKQASLNLQDDDIPSIPWLKEMIKDSQAPCFTSLPYKNVLKIWQNIFDNIGLNSNGPLLHKYLFPIIKDDMIEFTTLQLGNLYLNQLGEGFANPQACKWVSNLHGFQINPTECQDLIEKIIKTAIPDAETNNYQQYYDEDSRQFIISL